MKTQHLMTIGELKRCLTTEGEYSAGGIIGGTLLLRVRRNSNGFSRSWQLKSRAGGKLRKQTIGAYSDKKNGTGYSLEGARTRANEILNAWKEGRDIVQEEREAIEAAEPAAPKTIAELFPVWLDFQRERKARKNAKDFKVMESRFSKYLKKPIGRLLPEEITAAEIGKALTPLCYKQPATMEKIQGFLIQFFRWCQLDANGYRSQALRNPASAEALKDILPPRSQWGKTEHRAMCPLKDLPRFVSWLTKEEQFKSVAAMACLFEILTGSRFSNIGRNASYPGKNYTVWEDIDLDNEAGAVWIIPAEKMKVPGNGAHIVPLSRQAVAILRRIQKLGISSEEGVFLGLHKDVISDGSFAKLVRKISELDAAAGNTGFYDEDGNRMTLHGTARAGLRTWAADNGFSAEAAEAALHHKREELGTAYLRSPMLKERRKLMQKWADFCLSESEKDWASIKAK